MTYVGRILVIVIMVFALFFLAISTVVYSTAQDWKEEVAKQKTKIADLQKQITAAKTEIEATKIQLQGEIDNRTAELKRRENQIATLTEQNKQIQQELTETRRELEASEEAAKVALSEAEARRTETENLRKELADVQKQSNEFKIRQTELTDEVNTLQRFLETAKRNNENLRQQVAAYAATLAAHGISTRVSDLIRGQAPPPDVDGVVTRVDAHNRRVEISIGSDDGLAVGHELYLYRLKGPEAGYLGKIKIDMVDPDQAEAHVIGKTVQGKKIKEGDIVSTQIRARD
jgi:phage shock protein A